MARFILTLTVDDDELETVDDVYDTIERAWADENKARGLVFSGRTPTGAGLDLFTEADPSSVGVRLVRESPKAVA